MNNAPNKFNYPVKRLAWVKTSSKSFVTFWSDGSFLYKKLIWRLYVVTATCDCTTTGGALYYVDPKEAWRAR